MMVNRPGISAILSCLIIALLSACSGESQSPPAQESPGALDAPQAAQNASPELQANQSLTDASQPLPRSSLYPAPPPAGSPPLPPDQRAQVASEILDIMLTLEPTQEEQIYQIFLQSAKRTDQIFDTLPQDQWPRAFRDMQEQKLTALRATLSPKQFEIYMKNRRDLDPYMRFRK